MGLTNFNSAGVRRAFGSNWRRAQAAGFDSLALPPTQVMMPPYRDSEFAKGWHVDFPRTIDEITPEWLTQVLRAKSSEGFKPSHQITN